MIDKKRTIELANIVINFGETGLVENLKKRIFPLIDSGEVIGRGEVHAYRFLGIKVQEISEIPVLFGRLVKIMTIEAEQEFDQKKDRLISSSKQISSAPSSFFLINLQNHRMSYLGETRRSPTINDFEYCLKKLIISDWKIRYKSELDNLVMQEGKKNISKQKKEKYKLRINETCPEPDVRITRLPALHQLSKKFDAFTLITSLNIRPMKTNNELADENAEFLRKYEEQRKKIGSISASIELTNGKTGLDKNETEKLVQAASDGNFKVKVKGKAKNGNDLNTDLDEVSVKLKEVVPYKENDLVRAKRLLDKMTAAFTEGYVRIANNSKAVLAKAKSVVKEINQDTNE